MKGVDFMERARTLVDLFHYPIILGIWSCCIVTVSELYKGIHYDQAVNMCESWGYILGCIFCLPSTIHIFQHQYQGTSGGYYINCIITVFIMTPLNMERLYTYKYPYLTNNLLSKGNSIQRDELNKLPQNTLFLFWNYMI